MWTKIIENVFDKEETNINFLLDKWAFVKKLEVLCKTF